ncbi:MAG: hypothetical protein K6D94_07640 [Clostridiales bacterium]|nr:hypothetical protein [Clostridiales bacterium]
MNNSEVRIGIPISVDTFKVSGASAADGSFLFPCSGGILEASFGAGTFFGSQISPDMWIVADITAGSSYATAITWAFTDTGGHRIAFKMGLLPNLKTRIALPFSILNGERLFLPRTPGKLKTVTQGRPIKLSDLCGFSISMSNTPAPVNLAIHDLCLSDSEPDYPVPEKRMVDALGQKGFSDWPGRTKGVDGLKEFAAGELKKEYPPIEGRDRWGGETSIHFDATGYFRTEYDGKRYWLADPDGNAFISVGLDCVGIDGDANIAGIKQLCRDLPPENEPGWAREDYFSWHKHNLWLSYGEDWYNTWADLTKRRFEHWGFNTIGAWSDFRYIDREKQPYVFIFRGYPDTEKHIFRDFPDVYSDEFIASAEKWAQQLRSRAEDPAMIGYFMTNEPNFAFVNDLNLGVMLLESEGDYSCKDALIAKLRAKYETIETLNSVWNSGYASFDDIKNKADTGSYTEAAVKDLFDFTCDLIRRYVEIPAKAAKSVDPNHLNLGVRWAWLSSPALASGSEYFDVYSFNCYSMDPTETIERTLEFIKKPLIIGEFHFGALDRGLDATGLRAVTSQEERAKAYRYYMHRAAAHPYCVGAHYFTLNDQAYLGRFDGENYQIGLVDVCDRPYDEFVEGIRKTNHEIYDVALGKMPPTDEKANEIPTIAF